MADNQSEENLEKATFAGGCFWCMEPPFEQAEGVYDIKVGYSGGETKNPTYQEVSKGNTGHFEAIQITFDPSKVSYEEILNTYWKQIDPTDSYGQFADKGPQYKTAIFYHNEKQKELAEKSKQALQNKKIFDKPIATQILEFKNFYEAEELHQKYYQKNPFHYSRYKKASGREDYIHNTWDNVETISTK